MIYMSSNSANDGSYILTVSFKVGTDPDMQHGQRAEPGQPGHAELPEEVSAGMTTNKKSTNMLMVVNLFSPIGTYDTLFLRTTPISNRGYPGPCSRCGQGDDPRGADYAMRIWLDPEALEAYGLGHRGCAGDHPGAERAGGGRANRRLAGAARHPVSIHLRNNGRLSIRGRVRRHYYSGWVADGAGEAQGRCPHGAGFQVL